MIGPNEMCPRCGFVIEAGHDCSFCELRRAVTPGLCKALPIPEDVEALKRYETLQEQKRKEELQTPKP